MTGRKCSLILISKAGERRFPVGDWEVFRHHFQHGERLSTDTAVSKIDAAINSVQVNGRTGSVHPDVEVQSLVYAKGLVEAWSSRGEVEGSGSSAAIFEPVPGE